MSNQRLIEKMQKLLAMSESTSNEHEAMAATRKLHIMLAKHNISVSELDTNDEPEIEQSGEIIPRCRPWKRILGMHIAKLYFCEFYTIKLSGGKSKCMFVGTEENRMFALHIFKMVIQVVFKDAHVESRKLYGKTDSAFITSFYVGAKDRIVQRCKDMIQAAKEGTLEDEDGKNLPVLANVYQRNELMVNSWTQANLNLKSGKARTVATDGAGYAKGTETGNRVQLNRAVHGKASPKLIGG